MTGNYSRPHGPPGARSGTRSRSRWRSSRPRRSTRAIAEALEHDPTITHVGLVQSETGSGVVHDVDTIGAVVNAAGRRMIVDAVSAFGALPMDMSAHPEIDATVFTANKCLEALPGMAYAIARIDRLEQCAGIAGSWSLDLSDVYAQVVTRGDGRPRFTPPGAGRQCLEHRS